ncbi:hypothetical protein KAS08_06195 [Candidatus Pacearchaeota archaeon]|nr:hypothetical protein [Candidatus Pacearchaeota archaeon]
MKKNKMNKTTVTIIVMAVLLVGALGYVGFDIYSESQMAKMTEVYQEGASYGYELAVDEVFRLAGSCQKVPLTMRNQTIEIVDISCLQTQN